MPSTQPLATGPQAVETNRAASSKKRVEMHAADYSIDFHGKVIRTYAETLNMKETARLCKIPRSVVNEILHARDFIMRVPPASAVSRSFPMVRRVA